MPLTLDKGGNKLRRAPRAGGPTGQRVPVNTTHGSRLIAVLHLQSVASTQRPCPTAPGFLLRCGRARENSAADQSLSRESERSLLERPVKSRWEGPENKRMESGRRPLRQQWPAFCPEQTGAGRQHPVCHPVSLCGSHPEHLGHPPVTWRPVPSSSFSMLGSLFTAVISVPEPTMKQERRDLSHT
uniref:Uncharacterized protein n=1 Tax=Rangifer tarandus platyrhynchus TaxID=3082113 RepID=A0ACB0FJ62_RANTA|nr:unnamed protein product [Rangifer tarandus platyrhynchus]